MKCNEPKLLHSENPLFLVTWEFVQKNLIAAFSLEDESSEIIYSVCDAAWLN